MPYNNINKTTARALPATNPSLQAQEAYHIGVIAYYNRDFARNYEIAIAHLNIAIELAPDYRDAYYLRGRAFHAKPNPNYAAAISDFTRIIALDPSDINAYAARGFTYHVEQKYDVAYLDFERIFIISASASRFAEQPIGAREALNSYHIAPRSSEKLWPFILPLLRLTPREFFNLIL